MFGQFQSAVECLLHEVVDVKLRADLNERLLAALASPPTCPDAQPQYVAPGVSGVASLFASPSQAWPWLCLLPHGSVCLPNGTWRVQDQHCPRIRLHHQHFLGPDVYVGCRCVSTCPSHFLPQWLLALRQAAHDVRLLVRPDRILSVARRQMILDFLMLLVGGPL